MIHNSDKNKSGVFVKSSDSIFANRDGEKITGTNGVSEAIRAGAPAEFKSIEDARIYVRLYVFMLMKVIQEEMNFQPTCHPINRPQV